MKPIILVIGTPHSFTSMISNFLLDNNGYCPDLWDNPEYDMAYSRFESKQLQLYIKERHHFKEIDLTDFFKELPTDKVVTLKEPLLIEFINDIKKFTDRELKVVYVLRNPQDIILSSIEKSKKSFIYYFERIVWSYNYLINCELPVHVLVSEKMLKKDENTAKELLKFCELYDGEINFDSISLKKTKDRKPTYLKYRFANFFWKRLSIFFRIYNFKEFPKK